MGALVGLAIMELIQSQKGTVLQLYYRHRHDSIDASSHAAVWCPGA
jgi:hypothetical protein